MREWMNLRILLEEENLGWVADNSPDPEAKFVWYIPCSTPETARRLANLEGWTYGASVIDNPDAVPEEVKGKVKGIVTPEFVEELRDLSRYMNPYNGMPPKQSKEMDDKCDTLQARLNYYRIEHHFSPKAWFAYLLDLPYPTDMNQIADKFREWMSGQMPEHDIREWLDMFKELWPMHYHWLVRQLALNPKVEESLTEDPNMPDLEYLQMILNAKLEGKTKPWIIERVKKRVKQVPLSPAEVKEILRVLSKMYPMHGPWFEIQLKDYIKS